MSTNRKGYDLRLMSSMNDVSGMPGEGKNLIIVAAVGDVLHFRIFDTSGKKVVDTDEKGLTDKLQQINDLKRQLESLWPPCELTSNEKDRLITAVTSIVGYTHRKMLVLVATCFLSIVAVNLVATWVVNGPARPVPVSPSASSEVMIVATALSIHIPDPQEPIDASQDTLEPGKCWVVKAAVNRRVRGGDFVPDKTLNLLVHSPSQGLGVSQIGQVFEVSLDRTSKPVDFLIAPDRSVDPSKLPDTQHRRYSILTSP